MVALATMLLPTRKKVSPSSLMDALVAGDRNKLFRVINVLSVDTTSIKAHYLPLFHRLIHIHNGALSEVWCLIESANVDISMKNGTTERAGEDAWELTLPQHRSVATVPPCCKVSGHHIFISWSLHFSAKQPGGTLWYDMVSLDQCLTEMWCFA